MASAFEPGLGSFGPNERRDREQAAPASASPSLTLKRRLAAPPERVYAAWTDAEKFRQWFGCSDATVTEASFDVRVGGSFAIATRKESGEENLASGTYREVVPDRKLVFTWVPDRGPGAGSIVTLLITPEGTGSLLTLTHDMFADEETRDLHEGGWTGCLAKLEAFLA